MRHHLRLQWSAVFPMVCYQGPMVDDRYEGKGTFSFANGTQYVGDFWVCEFHGQGTRPMHFCTSYSGGFESGKVSVVRNSQQLPGLDLFRFIQEWKIQRYRPYRPRGRWWLQW